MKTKAIILIAISAIVTLSFTFASVNTSAKRDEAPVKSSIDAPAGGFASEDKI